MEFPSIQICLCPTGGKDTPKVGSAHRSAVPQASPPAKAKDSISKDRPASEPKSDPKKAPRSPPRARARANPTADQGNKAGSKAGSKGDAVGEKQAGRKRRSRSRERSRSPKRKASSPAARKSSESLLLVFAHAPFCVLLMCTVGVQLIEAATAVRVMFELDCTPSLNIALTARAASMRSTQGVHVSTTHDSQCSCRLPC